MKNKISTSQVDWSSVSNRFIKFREMLGVNSDELVNKFKIDSSFLAEFEQGKPQKQFKDVIDLCDKLQISSKWLLLGKGDFRKQANMKVRKGAGIRRSEFRKNAEEGEISDEVLEFVLALDQFKRKNNKKFLSITETYQVVKFLGYRKVATQADSINDI